MKKTSVIIFKKLFVVILLLVITSTLTSVFAAETGLLNEEAYDINELTFELGKTEPNLNKTTYIYGSNIFSNGSVTIASTLRYFTNSSHNQFIDPVSENGELTSAEPKLGTFTLEEVVSNDNLDVAIMDTLDTLAQNIQLKSTLSIVIGSVFVVSWICLGVWIQNSKKKKGIKER